MNGMGTASARLVVIAWLVVGCAQDEGRGIDSPWTPPPGGTTPHGDDAGDGSGDEESSAGDSDDGASADVDDGADTNAADSAPATDDGTPTEDSGDTGTGDPVLDACLGMATSECETCACNLCLDPLYACQQDVGCVAMRDCAEAAGCAGAECAEPCGAIIEMYGGYFGESATLALALSDCLEPMCPICF
jgi:hypothetical protein